MSVIPLAAMLVHHCTDEDGYVTIELHAPTMRAMAIAAKDEHDSLRARIAELEVEVVQLVAERAERMNVEDELASLRARVREYLDARTRSGELDPLGGEETEWIAACKAADIAEAALREEASD